MHVLLHREYDRKHFQYDLPTMQAVQTVYSASFPFKAVADA